MNEKKTEEKTSIANAIEKSQSKAKYDMQVKELLADKNILAPILKTCVDECKDMSVEEIKACIQGEVSVGADRIEGLKQEDSIIGEGTITYDIRFDIMLPSNECAKIIIDIEAQKNDTSYDIVTRGVFYLARMLSSQLKSEFEIKKARSYDDLKKVYSIWICMDAPARDKDTITKYSFKPEDLYGEFTGKARFDLATLVMIRLADDDGVDSKNKLIGMLTTLLSDRLKSIQKEEKLENKYGIPMTVELKEKVIKMCNLSDYVEERATQRGLVQGMKMTTISMAKKVYKSGKLSDDIIIQMIMEQLDVSNEEATLLFVNEIKNDN